MKGELYFVFLSWLVCSASAGLLSSKHDDTKHIPISHPSLAEHTYHRLASWVGAHDQPDDALDLDRISGRMVPESVHDFSSSVSGYGRAIYEGMAEPMKRLFTGAPDVSRMDSAMSTMQESWSRMRACVDQESRSLHHNARLDVDKTPSEYRLNLYLPGVREKDIKLNIDPDTRILTVDVTAETEGNCACEPESAFMQAVRSALRPGLSTYMSRKAGDIKDSVEDLFDRVTGGHHEPTLLERVNRTLHGLSGSAEPSVADRVRDLASGSVEKIKETIVPRAHEPSMIERAQDAASDTMDKIKAAVTPGASYLMIKRAVSDALSPHVSFTDRVKHAVGIHPPTIGERAKDSASDLYDRAREQYDRFMQRINELSHPSISDRIKSTVGIGRSTPADRAREAFDDFVSSVSSIYSSRFEPTLFEKFKRTVGLSKPSLSERAADSVKDAYHSVQDSANSAVDSAKDSLDHFSHSSRALLEWLKDNAHMSSRSSVSDSVADNYDALKRIIHDALSPHVTLKDRVKSALGIEPSIADRAKDVASDVYDKAREQYDRFVARINELSHPSMTDRIKSSVGIGSTSPAQRAHDAFDEFVSSVSSLYGSTFEPTLFEKFKRAVGLHKPTLTERAADSVKDAYHSVQDSLESSADSAKDTYWRMTHSGRALLEWLKDNAHMTSRSSVSDSMSDNYEAIKRSIHDALSPHATLKDRVKGALGMEPSAADKAKHAASDAYDKAREQYDRFMARINELSHPSMTDRIKSSVGIGSASSSQRAREAFDEFVSSVSSLYGSTFEPTLFEKFKRTVGLSSPSMTERAADSVKDAYHSVQDSLESSADSAKDTYWRMTHSGRALLEWLKDNAHQASSSVSDSADDLASSASYNYEKLKCAVSDALAPHATLKDRFKSALGWESSATDRAKDAASDVYDKAREQYDRFMARINELSHPSMTDRIKSSVGIGSSSSRQRAREAFDEFVSSVSSLYGSTIEPTVFEKFKRAVGLSSPSMTERAADSVKDAYHSVQDSLESSADSAKDSLGRFSDSGRVLLEWLKDNVHSSASSASDSMSESADQIIARARDYLDWLTTRSSSDSNSQQLADRAKEVYAAFESKIKQYSHPSWTDRVKSSVGLSHGSSDVSSSIAAAYRELQSKLKEIYGDAADSFTPSMSSRVMGSIKDMMPGSDRSSSLSSDSNLSQLLSIAQSEIGRLTHELERASHPSLMDKAKYALGVSSNADKLRLALGQAREKYESLRSRFGADSWPSLDELASLAARKSGKAADAVQSGAESSKDMIDDRSEQVQRAADQAASKAHSITDERGAQLQDAIDTGSKLADSGIERLQQSLSEIERQVQKLLEGAQEALPDLAKAAQSTVEKGQETVHEATDSAQRAVPDKVESVSQAAKDVADKVSDGAETVKDHSKRGVIDRIKDMFRGIPGVAAHHGDEHEHEHEHHAAGTIFDSARAWTGGDDEADLTIPEQPVSLATEPKQSNTGGSVLFAAAETIAPSASTTSVSTSSWLAGCKGSREGRYTRTEHLTRRFTLPVGVDIDKAHTSFSPKQHTLQIVLPRAHTSGRLKNLLVNLVDDIKDFPASLVGMGRHSDSHSDRRDKHEDL